MRRGEDEELAEAELVAGDEEWVLRLEEGVKRECQLSIVGLHLSLIREKMTLEGLYLGRLNSSVRVQQQDHHL